MCVILDANGVGDVFGAERLAGAQQLLAWLESPRARLAVGGKLLTELSEHRTFKAWAANAIKDGRVRDFSGVSLDRAVESIEPLRGRGRLKSDDEHVIALAQVSGARILYSNDGDLRDDFRNSQLVSRPQGRLYPIEGASANVERRRRNLLRRSDLCPNR